VVLDPQEIKELAPGMGEAVAKRTILRTKEDGTLETWADVARRVSIGNATLHPTGLLDYDTLHNLIAKGVVLMSGRHLQHGDAEQPNKCQELFTNCSTSATSFLLYYLLLNGSGVGRDYSDSACLVDWSYLPEIICVLRKDHPDYMPKFRSLDEIDYSPDKDIVFVVPDSREGWAKGLEMMETLAYLKTYKNHRLIFDFSSIRESGSPIGGMQNRPASGPIDTMETYLKVASIKNSGYKPWKQALYIDHYLAENVLVGGARRSARMATKWYKDPDIKEFIHIKEGGDLWTANMSVLVDRKYWKYASMENLSPESRLAVEISMAQYYNKSGEPGYINVDRLNHNVKGRKELLKYFDLGSKKYQLSREAMDLYKDIIENTKKMPYSMIVNPCSEIPLAVWGGYCVIGDLAPFHAETLDEVKQAGRQLVRALMRVNLMDSVYRMEVERTNRIGVSLTGLHEFAWKFFGVGFKDMVQTPMSEEAENFWNFLKELSQECREEARAYAKALNVNVPHTLETIKPAGTTSKLFDLTEGAHLLSMKQYLRWVQFPSNSPIIAQYKDRGYPTRDLKVYANTTIVGFPTKPLISRLGMGDKLVTAGEASMEEQFRYLQLIEEYWLRDKDKQSDIQGNQISYTLKYNPYRTRFAKYHKVILGNQGNVRCCAVMPQIDTTVYEYQPEEPVNEVLYEEIVSKINDPDREEDIDLEHLKCASGACPI